MAPERDGAAHDRQVAEDMKLVKRVDTYGEGLSDRETDLVESCVARLDVNMPLTEKQRKWMQDIDERKVR